MGTVAQQICRGLVLWGGQRGIPHWEPAPRPRRMHTGWAAGEARSSSSGCGEHTEGPWGQPGTFSHACPTRSWTVPSASVTFSAGSYFLQMQLMWVILVSGTHVLDQEMQRGRIRTLGATCLPRTLGAPCPPRRDAGSPLSPPGRWEPPSPPPGPCAVSGSPFGARVGLLGRGAVTAPSLGARSRARVPPSAVAGPCARVSASFAGVRGGLRAGDRALPGGPAPFTVCPCVLSSRESNWPAARPACPNEPISPSRRLCARRSFAAAANYGPQITRRPRPLCTHSGRRGFVPMVPSKVQRGFS